MAHLQPNYSAVFASAPAIPAQNTGNLNLSTDNGNTVFTNARLRRLFNNVTRYMASQLPAVAEENASGENGQNAAVEQANANGPNLDEVALVNWHLAQIELIVGQRARAVNHNVEPADAATPTANVQHEEDLFANIGIWIKDGQLD